jgi:hypothetical protein
MHAFFASLMPKSLLYFIYCAVNNFQSSTGNGHTTTSVDATPPEEAGRHEAEATRHGSDYQENTAATPRVLWQGQTTYPDISGHEKVSHPQLKNKEKIWCSLLGM